MTGVQTCALPILWQRQSAYWFNAACHRSLYSYQTRAALQLAVQYPHIAVTYLPLACTGATIDAGLFGSQRFRECPPSKSNTTCRGTVNSQIAELKEALTAAQRRRCAAAIAARPASDNWPFLRTPLFATAIATAFRRRPRRRRRRTAGAAGEATARATPGNTRRMAAISACSSATRARAPWAASDLS